MDAGGKIHGASRALEELGEETLPWTLRLLWLTVCKWCPCKVPPRLSGWKIRIIFLLTTKLLHPYFSFNAHKFSRRSKAETHKMTVPVKEVVEQGTESQVPQSKVMIIAPYPRVGKQQDWSLCCLTA